MNERDSRPYANSKSGIFATKTLCSSCQALWPLCPEFSGHEDTENHDGHDALHNKAIMIDESCLTSLYLYQIVKIISEHLHTRE
jgi:hypothetical protein